MLCDHSSCICNETSKSMSLFYSYFLNFIGKSTAGFGLKRLLPDRVYTPDSIAVDWIYKHIYWTDLSDWQIHVCDYYGVYRKTFVTKELKYPDALALSPKDGYLYFILFFVLVSFLIS